VFIVENATFKISQRTLLRPISVRFEQAKSYSLIEHNGWNKSMFIKRLAKQIPYFTSKIRFADKHITPCLQRRFRKRVAYLLQCLLQATNLTVYESATVAYVIGHELLNSLKLNKGDVIDLSIILHSVPRRLVSFY